MNTQKDIEQLTHLLSHSVSPYHCILTASRFLEQENFTRLDLTAHWDLQPGHGYYIPMFDSSLAAFTVGSGCAASHCLSHTASAPGSSPAAAPSGSSAAAASQDSSQATVPTLRMEAAHTDWPCLKLKPSPEVALGRYGKLNVEVYGSPILSTWMDRPLSMAGKVCVAGDTPFSPQVRIIDVKRPIAIVPNLAIHMNREVNQGVKLSPQTDMLPLLTVLTEQSDKDHYLLNLLAREAGCLPQDILDYDICLYNTDSCTTLGLEDEFFSAPRIDNLTSVQACLSGITAGFRDGGINVITLYDNEEVGSRTKQGAMSAVTDRILEKIYLSLGYDRDAYLCAVMDGFLLSMDVGHAMHPNHREKCDIKNQILPGDGVAIKMAAAQSYATDASCISVIEDICRRSHIPYKKFSNHSDMRGGSTLGTISSALLSIKTVDIGVPILAMHSAREMMGTKDQSALVALASEFFLV